MIQQEELRALLLVQQYTTRSSITIDKDLMPASSVIIEQLSIRLFRAREAIIVKLNIPDSRYPMMK